MTDSLDNPEPSSFMENFYALRAMFADKSGKYKQAFCNYDLARRKYIVSRASDYFARNKHEPAPLLNLKLLDMGCGKSHLAEELSFRGADVTAVDMNPEMLEEARIYAEEYGAMVDFIKGGPQELIKEGRQFSIVICMGIFDDIDNIDKYAWYISKLLEPDGVLIFSTKHKSWLSWFWHILVAQNWLKWVPKNTYKFAEFRSIKTIKKALRKHDIEILEVQQYRFNPIEIRWHKCAQRGSRYMITAKVKG